MKNPTTLDRFRTWAGSWRARPFQRALLDGLQSKPVYQGTANQAAVAKRRARNKVAARQRRVNRMRAAR